VKCDPTALSIFGAGASRDPLYFNRATRGTNQRFLVPICGDQNQCFRCAVLLDTPTAHGRSFQAGR
jgi:hypothetical protein